MKTKIVVLLMVAAAFIGGCSKDDGGTNAPPVIPEDWTFPPDSTDALGSMYCAQETVAVGTDFDVKVILYNVDSAFAAALEISYTGVEVQVLDALTGPFIGPDADILVVKKLEPDSSRASLGVTFKRGTHPGGVSGSGAIMKLKCRGKAAGNGLFSINTTKLEILKVDGSSAISLLTNGDLPIVVR
jgi:hypothetical protein